MARILLVDDDHDIRELARALLAVSGHEVHLADGAMNALHVLRDQEIDLMITDVNMPNFSGFDLVKMVRTEGLRDLTICMLTGRRDQKDITAALKAGVHDYIVKPLDPNLFLKKINELMLRRPVRERPVDEFVQARVKIQSVAHLEIEVRAVSELGLCIKTPHQFRPGTVLKIESELFEQIGIETPHLRVFSCQLVLGSYETRLSFMDLRDDSLGKVRDWIAKQTMQTRVAS